MGKIGDNSAVQSLVNSLKDDNYLVRVNAANALEIIGDERALPYLEEALKNSKGESQEFESALERAIKVIRDKE
jgi:HEAT repeat protein